MKQSAQEIIGSLLAESFPVTAAKWITAGAASFWVSQSTAIHVLVGVTIVDYLTGICAGFIEKKLSSDVAWRGLMKKGASFALIYAVRVSTQPLGLQLDMGETMAILFIGHELISVVENCVRIGVPVPEVVVQALLKVSRFKFATAESFRRASDTRESETVKPESLEAGK